MSAPLRCGMAAALTLIRDPHAAPKPGRNERARRMTQPLLADYVPILVFLVIAGGIAAAMLGANLVLARRKPDPEKLSAYECGFAPFDDTRRRFDVRFYLVAILFIIFDLEVAFLFPWAVGLGGIGWFGFFSMMAFLLVLTVGFLYEWRKGALEWE
ncbi:NADH-quinone oxidoreductase subunit A [Caldovatus sediminis]|uniref:NADH-quinone oxidoreductase subunit A n=2 Tax=Caldovatus sediminis TaxID=2041189 RepID=A0A8J2Z9S6_9PROT|nr:NADH-quinone oxidoreductase subunit A [Caldovatus sediminis]